MPHGQTLKFQATRGTALLNHTLTPTNPLSTDNKRLQVHEYRTEGNCLGFHSRFSQFFTVFSAISLVYKTGGSENSQDTHSTHINPYWAPNTMHKQALDNNNLSISKMQKYII